MKSSLFTVGAASAFGVECCLPCRLLTGSIQSAGAPSSAGAEFITDDDIGTSGWTASSLGLAGEVGQSCTSPTSLIGSAAGVLSVVVLGLLDFFFDFFG